MSKSHAHVCHSVVIKCDTNKIKVALDKVLCKNAQGQTLASVGIDRALLVVMKRLQTVNNRPTPSLRQLFECVVGVCLPHRFQSRLKFLQSLLLPCNFIKLFLVFLNKTLSPFPRLFSLILVSFLQRFHFFVSLPWSFLFFST